MRVVSFRQNERSVPGLLDAAQQAIFSLNRLGYSSVLEFISAGRAAWDGGRVALAAAKPSDMVRLEDVQLLAPIERPGKILCVGLNYRDHAAESKMQLPKTPVIFTKFSTAIIGHHANVVLPKATSQPDYEAELAIVIGKPGRHIASSDWQDHVFGYTILNDVTARDIQFSTSQWSLSKSFDTFAPMGPAIVTTDEISDPHALDIRLSIGSEILQNSNTRELIFKVPELIAYLSSVLTLEPGDMISTGTPAGVGFARSPQRWLLPGDIMTVEIESIGMLINPVVVSTEVLPIEAPLT